MASPIITKIFEVLVTTERLVEVYAESKEAAEDNALRFANGRVSTGVTRELRHTTVARVKRTTRIVD